MKKLIYISTVFCTILMASTLTFAAQGFRTENCDEAACRDMTPALIGGPVAHSSDLLTLRYLGAANLELTYRNQVILLATYYSDVGRQTIVVPVDDVVRADAIFMGHEDGDHIRDAAQVSAQTGALLYGNANVINRAVSQQGLPPEMAVELKSGDIVEFDGFTVEAIKICHSGSNAEEGPYGPTRCQMMARSLYNRAAAGEDLSFECLDECSIEPSYGTCREVLAYMFTFGKDFRFLYTDSAATLITDELKAVMERIGGSVDVGTVAHAGGHSITQVPYTMVEVKIFNPRLFFPNHHLGMSYEMNNEVLFEAIRAEMPNTEFISLQYNEPLCFNVKSHVASKVSPSGSVWTYDMKFKKDKK